MTNQPSISVRGEATLEVDPEIAVISVTVMARDKDRRRALDLLASRNGNVLAVVRSLGEAVEKVESGSASVYPEFKEGGRAKERITGYVARASVRVTITDFTVLSDLIPGLADDDMVAVTGPWWNLRPDSPVRRQARLGAARDALERAREYAEAFGGSVLGLVEVADTGLLAEQERGTRFVARAAAAGAAPGVADTAGLEFEPAKQTVQAQVEARFTMTPPELG